MWTTRDGPRPGMSGQTNVTTVTATGQKTGGQTDRPALRLRESAAMYRMTWLSAMYRADQEKLKTTSGAKNRPSAKREEYRTWFNCCFCCTDRPDDRTGGQMVRHRLITQNSSWCFWRRLDEEGSHLHALLSKRSDTIRRWDPKGHMTQQAVVWTCPCVLTHRFLRLPAAAGSEGWASLGQRHQTARCAPAWSAPPTLHRDNTGYSRGVHSTNQHLKHRSGSLCHVTPELAQPSLPLTSVTVA